MLQEKHLLALGLLDARRVERVRFAARRDHQVVEAELEALAVENILARDRARGEVQRPRLGLVVVPEPFDLAHGLLHDAELERAHRGLRQHGREEKMVRRRNLCGNAHRQGMCVCGERRPYIYERQRVREAHVKGGVVLSANALRAYVISARKAARNWSERSRCWPP